MAASKSSMAPKPTGDRLRDGYPDLSSRLSAAPARVSPPSGTGSEARSLNCRIHEVWIEGFKRVIAPGRNDNLSIRSLLQLGRLDEFLEPAGRSAHRWRPLGDSRIARAV